MMQAAPKDVGAIKDYHVHVYYDPSTKERAALLRFSVGGFVYLAALVVAFINAAAAAVLIAASAIYYVFERTSG